VIVLIESHGQHREPRRPEVAAAESGGRWGKPAEFGFDQSDADAENETRGGFNTVDRGDGRPGETVIMRWSYNKHRDCGAPIVDAFMEVPLDGSREPLTFRFREVSISSVDGRGPNLPIGPGFIAFTAMIPVGAPLGRAEGWVDHSYPDCPLVGVVHSPRVTFQIRR
jgi:hypothetical protein